VRQIVLEMRTGIAQLQLVAVLFATVLGEGRVCAQELPQVSTPMVFRMHFQSLAGEVAGKLKLKPGCRIGIVVESERSATMVENAFIQELGGKGCRTFVKPTPDSTDMLLSLSVLTEQVRFDEIISRGFLRTVSVDMEARVMDAGQKSAEIVGTFHRLSRDTVTQRDEGRAFRNGSSREPEELSAFQKMIGPLVVLTGGILVVYLFFTVRS
jgi:hypothetical protein